MTYHFGQKGIWKKCASETTKAIDVPCRILEDNKGVLYIFTDKPYLRGYKNLHGRTMTIFASDFIPDHK